MKTTDILVPNFEDIIFEKRNKLYGAYEIRKNNKRDVTISLIISTVVVFIIIGTIKTFIKNEKVELPPSKVTAILENFQIKIQVPPPPPPAQPLKALSNLESDIRYYVPIVIEDSKIEEGIVGKINIPPIETGLPVNAKFTYIEEAILPEMSKSKVPFTHVEEMPEFPGGEAALLKFIAKNTSYPQEAREMGIQGMVFVRFCVTSEGTIDLISVPRSIDPFLDREAMRVVKLLPKWKPGKQGGKPVPVWFTAPFRFKIIN